jgi:hypothetical protein
MSAKEWNERRYIEKVLKATANYARSKLAGYPLDESVEGYPPHCPTVWRVVLTVQYVPQPPPLRIIPTTEVDGRL